MKTPEASFSVLLMSLASSAAMAMGLAPNPESGETKKDREMAKFNIDLLLVLREKTKNNLTSDEQNFIESILHDLQVKFVEMK